MLYTVNDSSITSNSLDSLVRFAPKGSPILFYEDGVYNTIAGSRDEKKVAAVLEDHPVFALDADLEARGIKKIIPGIQVIGYDGFVELVEEQDVAPWL